MSLYRMVDFVFWALSLAILLRMLFSWTNADRHSALVRFVYQVSEPILAPLRRYIRPFGDLDITPMVALVLLELLRRILLSLIF